MRKVGRVKTLISYDPETGEKFGQFVVQLEGGERIGGKWVRLFQQRITEWAELGEMKGETLRVLLWLLGKAEWYNGVPGPKEAAKALRIHEASAYRAFRYLRQEGLVSKMGRGYSLSPDVGWKGTAGELEEAWRKTYQRRKLVEAQSQEGPKLLDG